MSAVSQLRTVVDEPETGGYTSPEVVALTGATYRQLDYWCRAGRLDDTAPGSGYHRRFTEREVELVSVVVDLLAAGFVLPTAWDIARALVDQGRYAATSGHLLITIQAPRLTP